MKNIKRILLSLLTVATIFSVSNCNQPGIDGQVHLGGYVYDNITGQKITDYTMTIDLAGQTLDTTNGGIKIVTKQAGAKTDPADLGKYQVMSSAVLTQTFIVNIVAKGYVDTHYTAAQLETAANSTLDPSASANAAGANRACPPAAVALNQCKDISASGFYYNVPLIPKGSDIATVATIKVVDTYGNVVSKPRLINTANAPLTGAWTYPGSNLPLLAGGSATYFPLAETVGTDKGVITIAKNTLFRGVQYTFNVTADGYTVSGAINLGASNLGGSLGTEPAFTTAGRTIVLTKETPATGAPVIIASTNLKNVNGVTVPVTGLTAVTYTFDQEIEYDDSLLNGATYNNGAGACLFAINTICGWVTNAGTGAVAGTLTTSALDLGTAVFGGIFAATDNNLDGKNTLVNFVAETDDTATTAALLAAYRSGAITVAKSTDKKSLTITLNLTITQAGDDLIFDLANGANGVLNKITVRAAASTATATAGTVLKTLVTNFEAVNTAAAGDGGKLYNAQLSQFK